MRIGVVGASGFVGTHLVNALRRRGDHVVEASLREVATAVPVLAQCETIVNLAGEPLAQRWTAASKERMVDSRVDAPRRLLDQLAAHPSRVTTTYISSSAIGYYGTSESATFVETSAPGDDFLANLCVRWEREAERATSLGMRVAIVRSGIVLGRDGGALKAMLPAFRAGVGGVVGNGRQWFSWIHIDDIVCIYLLAIDGARDVMNGTAPNPVTNATFTHALGRALHRPTIIPVPTVALRAMLGEGADMLLHGQRVLPERTQILGYTFRFPDLDGALRAIFAD